MALKARANEKLIKIGKYAGTYRYVMAPELYIPLAQNKVIKEAALRSGISQGVMRPRCDSAGEVIKAWATEGHSVALPGLGTMRFGWRAKSVANVNDVKTSLISSRRIIFTPAVDLKEELAKTSINITCYDRNGEEVRRVTSSDAGVVEDPDTSTNADEENEGNGSQNNGGSENSGSESTGGNGGTTPITPVDNGGNGGNTGGDGGDGGDEPTED